MSTAPMTGNKETRTGGCLCGSVRYQVTGNMRPVVYCHCSQCRRSSGHFVAATACAVDALDMIAEESLRWYKSSSHAERGFCANCGGNLFWRPMDGSHVSIMAGTIDLPTNIKAIAHIFTANASDFFEIVDGLPQFAQSGPDDIGTA